MHTDQARRIFPTSLARASFAAAQQFARHRPKPLAGDEPGYTPIFDGKSLDGWEGEPKYRASPMA